MTGIFESYLVDDDTIAGKGEIDELSEEHIAEGFGVEVVAHAFGMKLS